MNYIRVWQQKKAKPNVPKRLFWEYDYDRINWQKESVSIITRVIERGTQEEWDELAAFMDWKGL